MSSSVSKKEIDNFSKDAALWWDESGPFAPLHRMNPVRMEYVKEQICSHFKCKKHDLAPLSGLRALDIGCGGGLVCEPLARLGAQVTGLDADSTAIQVARTHAEKSNLDIVYECNAVENHHEHYDIVVALEILEHVTDVRAFVKASAQRVKPGGLVIFSTLNRTPKSFALGIVAAEYLLRWVPRGTHEWKKFVRPSELARAGRRAGLEPRDIMGLTFHPLKGEFALSRQDINTNYFMSLMG